MQMAAARQCEATVVALRLLDVAYVVVRGVGRTTAHLRLYQVRDTAASLDSCVAEKHTLAHKLPGHTPNGPMFEGSMVCGCSTCCRHTLRRPPTSAGSIQARAGAPSRRGWPTTVKLQSCMAEYAGDARRSLRGPRNGVRPGAAGQITTILGHNAAHNITF